MKAGIDAFWPDEGDWFNLHERIRRHQLYYQGHLQTTPNVRPWSLQRNGYPGIAQWGGWVWSGDTDSSWKTLEAQIAVGINYSLSIGPYWGSDIGGFYPNNELTGELYARWFQFAAFCGSFRSHGRTWWTRLPWGWGLSDMGPREHNNTNAPIPPDDRRNILPSEMNNPAIEPVARKYAELRYQLLPYTYTLAWEARDRGLPLMRAMWLHYPDDLRARGSGDAVHVGPRSARRAGLHEGRDLARGLPAEGRLVRLVDEREDEGWRHRDPSRSISARCRCTFAPVRSCRSIRCGSTPRSRSPSPRRSRSTPVPTASSRCTRTTASPRSTSRAAGTWIRMTWNDRARQLSLEPGAPKGATNLATTRTFRVLVLPAGTTKDVSYEGKTVTIRF